VVAFAIELGVQQSGIHRILYWEKLIFFGGSAKPGCRSGGYSVCNGEGTLTRWQGQHKHLQKEG
jgi:hypothetical protein